MLSKQPTARLAFSLFSTLLRSVLLFATGMLLARRLGVEAFGDLEFLLGSFSATKSLLDLGTSTAFFTMLSQRERPRGFLLAYIGWQMAQFLVMLALILVILPGEMVAGLWLNEDRGLLATVLLASFLSEQAWQTFTHVGEARRRTLFVQSLGLLVGCTHLGLILWYSAFWTLTVENVLWFVVFEYLLAIGLGAGFLKGGAAGSGAYDFRENLDEYVRMCKPLIVYTLMSFGSTYLDNWLLQYFGGSAERGVYALAYRLASAGMLVSSAIVFVLWKEIAEAHARGDVAFVASAYRRVTRFVWFGTAAFAGALLPFSREIAHLLVGADYPDAHLIVGLMLVYPTVASLGQVVGVFFLAMGLFHLQLRVGWLNFLLSIPIACLLLADDWGASLGAVGMSLKVLLVASMTVGVMVFMLGKREIFMDGLVHRLGTLFALVLLGFGARALIVDRLIDAGVPRMLGYSLCLAAYFSVLAAGLFRWPALIGLSREDLRGIAGAFRRPGLVRGRVS